MQTFITIPQLKIELGATSIEIVKNPTGGKLFANTDNGVVLKVQQDIDLTKSMKFIYQDDIKSGCIINVRENSQNVVATL